MCLPFGHEILLVFMSHVRQEFCLSRWFDCNIHGIVKVAALYCHLCNSSVWMSLFVPSLKGLGVSYTCAREEAWKKTQQTWNSRGLLCESIIVIFYRRARFLRLMVFWMRFNLLIISIILPLRRINIFRGQVSMIKFTTCANIEDPGTTTCKDYATRIFGPEQKTFLKINNSKKGGP